MAFSDEGDFERALITVLFDKGWSREVIKYPTEKDLIRNWADILYRNNCTVDRLDKYPLTDSEMGQILDQIKVLGSPYALNGFINGKTVSIVRDNPEDKAHLGKSIPLKIYDRNEIAGGTSVYQIAEQPRFTPRNKMFPARRGDFMLLINGMPVIHVELKRSKVDVTQAAYQIQNYSHEGVFRGIFSLVQVFVAMTPEETVYFANPGDGVPLDPQWFFHWADRNNEPINDWKKIAEHLLSIPMAHQMIGFYTVADGDDEKLKVMRSYQYYAAMSVAKRVSEVDWTAREIYGGFIWHTTGSGKTMTSFKSAQLISESNDADKVVFLLDRIELGTQTAQSFKNFADDATDVQETENTDELIAKLKSAAGADKLIVTSLQKMSRIKDESAKAADIALIRRKRVVFVVDEAHRDTAGEMLGTIKKTFPEAIFFGFSGTPILSRKGANGKLTSDIFGDELHRYSIADGIRDKNVLGFDPNLVQIYPDADVRQQVALREANAKDETEALANPDKSKVYLKYMSGEVSMEEIEAMLPPGQYDNDGYRQKVVEHISRGWAVSSRSGKFHALLATSSIAEAIEYYKLFKAQAPQLKVSALFDPNIDNNAGGTVKSDAMVEILTDYNARYGKRFTIPHWATYKKDVALRLAHRKPYAKIDSVPGAKLDLLIVVDQMLTGYDSKWINTLFLDKVLENERVVQAFSRTNRLFGPDKPFGNIYYYRKPNTMRSNIEKALKEYSGDKPVQVFVSKLGDNLLAANGCFANLRNLFALAGAPDFEKLPDDESECERFAVLFVEFSALVSAIEVQGFRWGQEEYFPKATGKAAPIRVDFTYENYQALTQRYKELLARVSGGGSGGGGGGGTGGVPPFVIKPTIIQIGTGRIDANYMNSRFTKFLKALPGSAEQQALLDELHRSFATLNQEDQRYAKQILADIQNGNLTVEPMKTFTDYIAEYAERAKNDQIHQFADVFGADEHLLRVIMSHPVTAATLNQFNRFDALIKTVDKTKAAVYFSAVEGHPVSAFSVTSKVDDIFRRFILQGGFPIAPLEKKECVAGSVICEIGDELKYREYLPVWSFRVACGKNWSLQLAESLGWMKCEHMGKLDETMFVVQAEGNSMKGLVEDGEYCVMRKLGGGSMENKTLLIQEYDAAGPEGGGAYALKKFTRKDDKVVLVSRNPAVADIVLENDAEYSDKYRAIAEFKRKL